jgi:hypothetical protein
MPITPSKYIRIDGTEYKVRITNLKRKGDVLDLVANRTEDGVLHREIIGTYYNYTLGIETGGDMDEYNDFWWVVTAPSNHMIILPYATEEIEGYFGSCQDEIYFINADGMRVKGFTCNMVAVRAARTPAAEGIPSTQ